MHSGFFKDGQFTQVTKAYFFLSPLTVCQGTDIPAAKAYNGGISAVLEKDEDITSLSAVSVIIRNISDSLDNPQTSVSAVFAV